MRTGRAAFLLLATAGGLAGQGDGQEAGSTLNGLLERMEKSQQQVTSLQARLEITSVLPDVVSASGKPAELRTLMRVASLRTAKGESSRLDVDVRTEQGPLRIEKVRTPEGIWIHQASELVGERWLRVDRKTMERLDRAHEVLGGSLLTKDVSRAGAVLGAELIRGLLLAYDVSLAEDVALEDTTCWQVLARLRKDADRQEQGSLPRERPDEMRILVDKSSLMLRRLVQSQAGKPLLTVDVRQLVLNPKLDDPSLFSHESLDLPEGGRWVDVMQDPLASVRIREDLERLEEVERERAKPKEATGESGDKGKAKEGEKK